MVTEDPRFGHEHPDDDDEYADSPLHRDSIFDATDEIPVAEGGAGGGFPPGGFPPGGFPPGGDYFDDDEFANAEPINVDIDRDVQPLPEHEASGLVGKYLFPTEKFRGEWRRHWIHLAQVISIGIIATFVLGYASGYFAKKNWTGALAVLVLIWIAVMMWVLWAVVEWYYDRFVLTNKRIMLVEGIVARKVAMMPLARVTDMKYTQTALGRVLGYGTFEIESAGQDQALRKVENLPNPTDLYLQVVEEMYEPEASEARRRPAPIDIGDDGT
jgi:membrane protein YdbS with pleckstrin-like domain